jgi:hypothetical protein
MIDKEITLLNFVSLNYKDYLYGAYRGIVRFVQYFYELRFRKIYYILFSLFILKRCLILKVAIEKIRRLYPNMRTTYKKVKDLRFGHPVDFKYDFELNRRITELSKIDNLDLDTFNSICPSYGDVEVWNNIVLDGNGRLRALLASNNEEFELRVLERY